MQLVSPTDSNAVSASISVRIGETTATRIQGNLPAPSSTGNEPSVSASSNRVTAINGQTAAISINVSSISDVSAILQQVVGASEYFLVDLSTSAKADTAFTIEISIPENITDGQFCLDTAALDSDQAVSAPLRLCVQIESTADDSADTNGGFTGLSAGTYLVQPGGNGAATELVLNAGGTGTSQLGSEVPEDIDWAIDASGVLVTTFLDGSAAEYALTSGTASSGEVLVTPTNEPSATGTWSLVDNGTSASTFSSVTPGTYASTVEGDSSATQIVLSAGGTGTVTFASEASDPITWTVDGDGVLVLFFESGATESYSLIEGSSHSGTVRIGFSNEDPANGTWDKIEDEQRPGFSALTPGTYAVQFDGDPNNDIFDLNEGGTGTLTIGDGSQENITWAVDADGVLVINGDERYTLVSGTPESGRVRVDFSDGSSDPASWNQQD
ncbi:MAG: hypothetical protein CMH65_08460 [Nevskiales bacterium]|nr:hypothetical protein [Nevskiales bacterium]